MAAAYRSTAEIGIGGRWAETRWSLLMPQAGCRQLEPVAHTCNVLYICSVHYRGGFSEDGIFPLLISSNARILVGKILLTDSVSNKGTPQHFDGIQFLFIILCSLASLVAPQRSVPQSGWRPPGAD